jgi:hypothetical protein
MFSRLGMAELKEGEVNEETDVGAQERLRVLDPR